MPADQTTLFARLDALGIPHVTVEHTPVFTVEESQALRGTLSGAHAKNLFLKDRAERLALVVAKEDTRVDLKALAPLIGMGRLSFGSAEQLMAVLGVAPGSVTLSHSSTTRLATGDLLRFIVACGHTPLTVALA